MSTFIKIKKSDFDTVLDYGNLLSNNILRWELRFENSSLNIIPKSHTGTGNSGFIDLNNSSITDINDTPLSIEINESEFRFSNLPEVDFYSFSPFQYSTFSTNMAEDHYIYISKVKLEFKAGLSDKPFTLGNWNGLVFTREPTDRFKNNYNKRTDGNTSLYPDFMIAPPCPPFWAVIQ